MENSVTRRGLHGLETLDLFKDRPSIKSRDSPALFVLITLHYPARSLEPLNVLAAHVGLVNYVWGVEWLKKCMLLNTLAFMDEDLKCFCPYNYYESLKD